MHTFTRVNPLSYYQSKSSKTKLKLNKDDNKSTKYKGRNNMIETSTSTNEVRIGINRWIVDTCLDDIDHTSANSSPPSYADQEQLFQSISGMLSSTQPAVYVWAIGGPAAGKSHTLFGNGCDVKEVGVVHRCIDKMFGTASSDRGKYTASI
jgi:hypothetical protein